MRIAHVTDLHVLSLDGAHLSEFFSQRLVGGANLLFNRRGEYPLEVTSRLMADINGRQVDHVIVSGDLTNLSLPSEFERARQLLAELELPSAEVTVVPGNHDCYTLSERIKGNFRRILSPYLEGDLKSNESSRPVGFPFVRLRGPVAIIALSTAHVSPPLMATGTLGPRQLAAVEELLGRPEVRSRFRLVVLHHPPRSRYSTYLKRLTDADAFIEMIERVGAELIVHGHLHRNLREELAGPAGPVPLLGLNSSTWMAKDPARVAAYNIYEVDPDGRLLGIEHRRYDRSREAYVDGVFAPVN